MISQAKVSNAIIFFKKNFLEYNNLSDYSSLNSPTVFLGLYNQEDIDAYKNHVGVKAAVFTGADVSNARLLSEQDIVIADKYFEGLIKKISSCKIINHVIKLRDYSLYQPVKLGKHIYCYQNSNSDGNKKKYGYYLVDALIEKYGDSVIVGYHGHTTDEMIGIYKKCYINIQPYPIPGYASAMEMAHMGRQSISNRPNPFSIPFSSVGDVFSIIDNYNPLPVEEVSRIAVNYHTETNWKDLSQYKK